MLDTLFEDELLLAVAKPAGMVVHPTYKNPDGTIVDALGARAWPAGQRPSIVGRLDKLTSGVVIVAKTATAHAALQRALASADSVKEYVAVVYGRVDVERGEIDLRLAHDPADRRRIVASPDVGRPSLTRFERVAVADAAPVGASLLRCRLATGRRHQIRVHLAARGWPIVGDPAYGEPRWRQIHDPAIASVLRAFERQALHASRVSFVHPATRQRVSVAAPLPPDLDALVAALFRIGVQSPDADRPAGVRSSP